MTLWLPACSPTHPTCPPSKQQNLPRKMPSVRSQSRSGSTTSAAKRRRTEVAVLATSESVPTELIPEVAVLATTKKSFPEFALHSVLEFADAATIFAASLVSTNWAECMELQGQLYLDKKVQEVWPRLSFPCPRCRP